MKDFFVSYTSSDKQWAEWVSWQLEEAGYDVMFQAWDFSPGANFVLEMNKASERAKKTIAILSHEYLNKGFPSSEWAAAFTKDPDGNKTKLIPIRIADIVPPGLLSSIIYIDLYDCKNEEDAKMRLIEGVSGNRTKPSLPPSYPLVGESKKTPSFPGSNEASSTIHNDTKAEKIEIEIKINAKFDDFTDKEKEKFLLAMKELLDINYDIKITNISPGSVLLSMVLYEKDALKLFILTHIGKVPFNKVVAAKILWPKEMNIHDVVARLAILEAKPSVPGERELGQIVYLNRELGYGIIERERGGYLVFDIEASEKLLNPGARVQVEPKSNFRNAEYNISDQPPNKAN